MRLIVLVILLLLGCSRTSLAFDEDVDAELEKLARRDDAANIVFQLQDELFKRVSDHCSMDVSADCFSYRLATYLDETGLLAKHCRRGDSSERAYCNIFGAQLIPVVEALGGDPDSDVDWDQVTESHSRFELALEEAARATCESRDRAALDDCMVIEQATLLGFSPTAAKVCSQKLRFNKAACLKNLREVAIYLVALRRAIGKSKSL